MEAKHTPGPWKIFGGPSHPQRHHLAVIDSIPDVDGKIVANCICHLASTNPDSDANAQLIATAPDLLEACDDALSELMGTKAATDFEIGGVVSEDILEQLRAVITKAGGTPSC